MRMRLGIKIGSRTINWYGYLAAIVFTALATWLKYLAQPNFIPADVPILYLLAIVPTAIFFGLGPAILVSLLSVLAFDYFFIPPLYTIGPRTISTIPILGIFLLVGVLFSVLASNLRQRNIEAHREIALRQQNEAELIKYREHLEELVNQRTIELEQANLALRRSEQQWVTTLASIGDAVIATDTSGKITFMNTIAEKLTGWASAEALQRPIGDVFAIISEDTRRKAENPVDVVLAKGVVTGLANHTLLIRKDGIEVAIDDSGAPIKTAKGEVNGVVLVFRDITGRRHAEEELERYTAELEESNQDLESFSYSVSHDLRAPLRSITAFSQILLEDYSSRLDEEGKKHLELINSSACLMATLIDDILALSRVVSADMETQEISLSELAEEVAVVLNRCEPERKVEFKIAPGLYATGDRNLMKVVFDNLLNNAFKFTAKTVPAVIEFGAQTRDGRTVYFVRDNGDGFDMTYVHKLFKPFQRLHSTSEFPGNGIGLASVQKIIHRHGGKVWAEGEKGQGATFYFTLAPD